jgi:hypothetical protein
MKCFSRMRAVPLVCALLGGCRSRLEEVQSSPAGLASVCLSGRRSKTADADDLWHFGQATRITRKPPGVADATSVGSTSSMRASQCRQRGASGTPRA